MKLKITCLLVSCFIVSQVSASAASSQSAANVQPVNREACLKKALERYTTGKVPASVGEGPDVASELIPFKSREDKIVEAHITAMQNPDDKDAQKNIMNNVWDYNAEIEEYEKANVPMDNRFAPISQRGFIARLLLQNALLTHKVQRLEQEMQPGS